jgi:hypothetical protein
MRMRTSLTVEPDISMALDFLDYIFAPALEGYVNLFSVEKATGQRRTAWAPVEDLACAEAIWELGQTGDVWFGCALRKEPLPNGQRGGIDDCLSIPGLWLDVDVGEAGHRRAGYAKSYEEARQFISGFGTDYDAIVQSGYGFQAWWRFNETLDAKEALPVLARWRHTWLTRAATAGIEIDDVWDIPRVMRLPGTFNFKGSEPVKATVRVRRSGTERQWAPFVEDRLEVLPEPVEKKTGSSTAHLAGTRFNELADPRLILEGLAGCELVKVDREAEHYHYPNAENDLSVTRYLDDDHVTIWSETMAAELGLEVRRPYDKFGLWTALRHRGNFGAAHSELVSMGIPDNLYQPNGATVKDVIKPPSLTIVRTSEVTPTHVRWLWPGWAPRGKLIDLTGDPGTGKSTMCNDLAARLTTGRPMPDQTDSSIGPASVLFLSGEDDLEDTIVWRLMAAGADLDRIYHIQTAMDGGEETPVVLPRDVDALAEGIERTGSVMVVIDVLNEYLDAKVDNYRDADVRRALARLRKVARDTDSSIVMLRHLRKEAGKAIYRGGGSIGIVGAARAGWTVAHHIEDPSLRVIASTKMNLTVEPVPLAFKLLPAPGMEVARVDWRGPVEGMTAEILLGEHGSSPDEVAEKRSLVEEVVGAIESAIPPGRANAVLSHKLQQEVMRATGCSLRTYKTAHARVEFGKGWWVELGDKDKTKGRMVWRPGEDDQ